MWKDPELEASLGYIGRHHLKKKRKKETKKLTVLSYRTL
jgi:hypothetical protein